MADGVVEAAVAALAAVAAVVEVAALAEVAVTGAVEDKVAAHVEVAVAAAVFGAVVEVVPTDHSAARPRRRVQHHRPAVRVAAAGQPAISQVVRIVLAVEVASHWVNCPRLVASRPTARIDKAAAIGPHIAKARAAQDLAGNRLRAN